MRSILQTQKNNLIDKLIIFLFLLYIIGSVFYLVSAFHELWYAKPKAIENQLPLFVYLQKIGIQMSIFIHALIATIAYFIGLLGLKPKNRRYRVFSIIVLLATALYCFNTLTQYQPFIEYFHLSGSIIIFLSLISAFYLIRIENIQIRKQDIDERYRLINYYVYALSLVALLQFCSYFIIYLYYGELIWQSPLQLPFKLSDLLLKILLVYNVIIFMVCIFCGSKLWNFEKKTRLLAILLFLFMIAYSIWLLYLAVPKHDINIMVTSIIYIIINLACLIYVKKHRFSKIIDNPTIKESR